jgi:hypothetical protein
MNIMDDQRVKEFEADKDAGTEEVGISISYVNGDSKWMHYRFANMATAMARLARLTSCPPIYR